MVTVGVIGEGGAEGLCNEGPCGSQSGRSRGQGPGKRRMSRAPQPCAERSHGSVMHTTPEREESGSSVLCPVPSGGCNAARGNTRREGQSIILCWCVGSAPRGARRHRTLYADSPPLPPPPPSLEIGWKVPDHGRRRRPKQILLELVESEKMGFHPIMCLYSKYSVF